MAYYWDVICVVRRTVFANDNECLAEASLIEYAYGFRGAAILVLLFSVLINIELTYAGEVKYRHNNVANNNNNPSVQNNNNNDATPGVGLVVAPAQQVTTTNDDEDEDGNDNNEEDRESLEEPGTEEQDTIVR
eukprot:CAMPEP_0201575772 /NCGR_PEP_ID=MMETSP0190_2-20130828/21186_1 /ASSEMBLY_ACC=CAM_ASM_000263 /TAXON_ID=37353 /ORGANISM="Rosalina sp." /LENGTH=132 /DNA_ID=CAMNT_0048005817 /DNA_START=297 /DNA_END=696 /DNA_ORIENTATION=-